MTLLNLFLFRNIRKIRILYVSLKDIFNVYNCLAFMYVCVPHLCLNLQRSEEGIISCGIGVTGSCELTMRVLGTEPASSARTASAGVHISICAQEYVHRRTRVRYTCTLITKEHGLYLRVAWSGNVGCPEAWMYRNGVETSNECM